MSWAGVGGMNWIAKKPKGIDIGAVVTVRSNSHCPTSHI